MFARLWAAVAEQRSSDAGRPPGEPQDEFKVPCGIATHQQWYASVGVEGCQPNGMAQQTVLAARGRSCAMGLRVGKPLIGSYSVAPSLR
eukprot:6188404-Pleurochrysis_carterae.AAC.3